MSLMIETLSRTEDFRSGRLCFVHVADIIGGSDWAVFDTEEDRVVCKVRSMWELDEALGI